MIWLIIYLVGAFITLVLSIVAECRWGGYEGDTVPIAFIGAIFWPITIWKVFYDL